jgi:hypothetical protein
MMYFVGLFTGFMLGLLLMQVASTRRYLRGVDEYLRQSRLRDRD